MKETTMDSHILALKTQDLKRAEKVRELPEILIQNEMRENFEYQSSANLWYWPVVVDGKPLDTQGKAKLLLSQKKELPFLMSAVMERACSLQCAHCLYGNEKSSQLLSKETHLAETIQRMTQEMPRENDNYKPRFMSCGRILRPWHLDIFQNIRKVREDIELGIIDNGTYINLLDKWPDGFKFDWVDISIDGTREHHNQQRGSSGAFDGAIRGLGCAREIVKSPEEGGKVFSLLTLTKINARDIEIVATMLLSKKDNGLPLADKLMVTTMSPTNEVNAPLEVSAKEFSAAWEGLKNMSKKYPPVQDGQGNTLHRLELSLYRVQDLEKLASVIGEREFMDVFHWQADRPNEAPKAERNNLVMTFNGVKVSYLPLSIWPPEEFLIEADAVYRTAYEGTFTLEEHRAGRDKNGNDITPYTVENLDAKTSFRVAYEKGVDHWWQYFGREKFEEELEAFKRIRAKAKMQGWIQPTV